MSPEQRQMYQFALPYVEMFARQPPNVYPGAETAGFNPIQKGVQKQIIGGVAPELQRQAGQAAEAQRFLTSDVLFPGTNPALQRTIEAGTRPITEDFLESVLPSLRHQEMLGGTFGGTAGDKAAGIAAGKASQAVGDVASRTATQAYESGLGAMTRALGLAPQTAAMSVLPSQLVGAVGDVRQAMQQAIMDEAIRKYYQREMLPINVGKELMGLISGIPGGTMTTQQQMPQQNPMQSILGMMLSGIGMLGGGTGAPFAGLF